MPSSISFPYTFTANTLAQSFQVNQNFAAISTFVNSTGIGVYQAGTVNTAALADGSVTTVKVADGAITSSKISAIRTVGNSEVPNGGNIPTTDLLANLKDWGQFRIGDGFGQIVGTSPWMPHSDLWFLKAQIYPRQVAGGGIVLGGYLASETLAGVGLSGDGAYVDASTAATTGANAYVGTAPATSFPDYYYTFAGSLATGSSIASQRVWIGPHWTSNLQGFDTVSAASLQGYAFRYSTVAGDTTWKLVVNDGTTEQVINTGVTVVADTSYYFLSWFGTSGKLNFTVIRASGLGGVTAQRASGTSASVVTFSAVGVTQGTLGAGIQTRANAIKTVRIGLLSVVGNHRFMPSDIIGSAPRDQG